MSFSRSNNKMVISLLTLLVFLIVATNTYYYNKMSETKEEVEKLKKSERLKENEILNLESKIKTVNEKLTEKENEILKLEEELNKVKNENENLKEENSNLKSENEKLKDKEVAINTNSDNDISGRKINVVATAYTSDCKGCTGITSTGYDVRKNKTYNGMKIIASDPNIIPMNSVVLIKTDNSSFKAISLDTGGAIKGNRIDILMDTKDDAYNFGRQNVEVTILKGGQN